MIYCVEDDNSIRELMLYALRASGFSAAGFETAGAFWQGIRGEKPELVLLDIMLPDEDGISVLKKLRASPATAEIPVIMATAKGTEFDKVIGLDQGADDYLSKPFGMMEMVSRVKAVLRRSAPRTEAALLQYRNIEMNESSHRVSVSGVGVELTVKEYALLRLFLKNPGVAFTRENLLSAVWESDYQGETRTVDVHIASLRTKLKDAGEFIRTVRGVGYRLEDPT
ncbi:MAG: response regulator transcription factor [Firmicutes bacterium]|nr:response regulator transcription factor [Bacillota bacterium]